MRKGHEILRLRVHKISFGYSDTFCTSFSFPDKFEGTLNRVFIIITCTSFFFYCH